MSLSSKQKKAVAKLPAGKRADAARVFEQQNQAGRRAGPRKEQRRPKQTAGRPKGTGDIFHPAHPGLIPSLVCEGSAFPIQDIARAVTNATSVGKRIIIGTNTGRAGSIWVEVLAQPTPTSGVRTVPLLGDSDTAGGPTSGRAMKFSMTLVNTTNAFHREGRVYTLNANQRFALPAAPSTMTQAQWNEFADAVTAHPKVVAHSAEDFAKPKSLVAHPVDQASYTDYGEWHGTYTLDEFMSHCAIWPGQTPADRPMSTIVVVLDPTANTNNYVVTGEASFYTRWPLSTVMGRSMRKVPTAPADHINRIRDHAENTSSMLRSVGEAVSAGYALASGASAGIRALGSVARGLPALEAAGLAPLALMA